MDSETAMWVIVAMLWVRSVVQQIYIRRLKTALLTVVDSLQAAGVPCVSKDKVKV